MNERCGDSIKDTSGYKNNGTFSGDPAWTLESEMEAIQFDGTDDYIDCGTDSSLNLTGPITIAFWVKWTASAGVWDAIIGKGSPLSAAASSWVFTSVGNGNMRFYIRTASDTWAYVQTSFTQNDGNWHFIAGTYDFENVRTYHAVLPNEIVESTPTAETDTIKSNASTNLSLGENFGGGANPFGGYISKVLIYPDALNLQQIEYLYHNSNYEYPEVWISYKAAVAVGARPQGPLGHPLKGALGGPI